MKKIFCHIILLLLLLTSLNACSGYKPIFGSTNLQFEIADYSIEGNQVLGNKIFSRLDKLSKSKQNNENTKSINLLINISQTKNLTSKDSSGKILEYRITLNAEIKVDDFLNNNSILNQTFVSSTTYKAQDQHSDTLKIEKKSIESLINNIYEKLLLKLSQNISAL